MRENGGQYTHAACWVVRAFAEAGRHDRAAQLLEMLTPVSHAVTREMANTFRVEPCVVTADIYGAQPHIGRGGWSWYTGSASWRIASASRQSWAFTRSCWPLACHAPGPDTVWSIAFPAAPRASPSAS
ncbi:MAG: hypothetical protein U1E76_11890 [Planctomycetota bacterium]